MEVAAMIIAVPLWLILFELNSIGNAIKDKKP